MLKGFKDFIMRGNVIELAVAVVIGAAFTAIITAFTSGIVEPLLAALGGNATWDSVSTSARATQQPSWTWVASSPQSSTSSSWLQSSTS